MRHCLPSFVLVVNLVPWLGAQALPELPEGSLLATTHHDSNPAGRSIQVIDPFTWTAQPLAIQGLSWSSESPRRIFVESARSFLVTTQDVGRLWNYSHVYRVTWSGSGWSAQPLETSHFGTGTAQPVRIGNDIFVVNASGDCSTNTVVWQLPAGGGTPVAYVALGPVHGAVGMGMTMIAIGTVLHVFTFNTCTTGSEHWSIDTGQAPPFVQRLAVLPRSLRACAQLNQPVAAVQADYDATSGLIVVAGRVGDVLWMRPSAPGGVVRHRTLPGVVCQSFRRTDIIQALAVNPNTGSLGFGDFDRSIEDLRCVDGLFRTNVLTLSLPVDTIIWGLTYVSAAPNYLPVGAGCAQTNGVPPCSHMSSLPAAGNLGFAATLDSTSSLGVLLVGTSNTSWGGLALPWDLRGLGAPGCLLATSVEATLVSSRTGPEFRQALPLPPNLMGSVFYTQWLVADAINPLGFVLSDARRMRVW